MTTQPMLFGLHSSPPHAAGSKTSREAAESMAECAGSLIQRVLAYIRDRGGATCDECECALGMPHQTASARIRELFQRGRVRDSGKTRATRSGRKATVWEPIQ